MENQAMSRSSLGVLVLCLRLIIRQVNPVTLITTVVLVAASGTTLWMLHLVLGLEAARDQWRTQIAHELAARAAALRVPAPPARAPDHLAQFYKALGERRYAEQQIKTLFGLAAKNGLPLAQGEYKADYDHNTQVATYKVNLPVKGSYEAIWRFAMDALRAIPFASLDHIGFKRDTISDPQVEARLQLTLYLSDRAADSYIGAGGAQ
ncbi:hypothetical protein GCM10027321_36340 [Massilia terrae]|uniref:Transmembrane protein n=1 Tax=Massilia terrae TaxID=1811224 RepID=A0ABT2D3F1_9BURK|nr:hypothetical protein [Massilia terrae]MCS0660783.1 hypothetical protein [Massilia terrae]